MSFHRKLLVLVFLLIFSLCTACSNQLVTAPLVANPPDAEVVQPTLIPDKTLPPEPTLTSEPTAMPEIASCPVNLVKAVPEYNNKNLLYAFQTDDHFVVLTIDDGYSNTTLIQMLDLLEKKKVNATFFLVGTSFGEKLKSETLKRLVVDGNDIAYHSYAHQDVPILEGLSTEDWLKDYQQWSDALRSVIGNELFNKGVTPYSRAPWGDWTTPFMESSDQLGLIPVYWSADEHAFEKNRTPLKNGSILILHVDPGNLDELEELLDTDWNVISLRQALGVPCN